MRVRQRFRRGFGKDVAPPVFEVPKRLTGLAGWYDASELSTLWQDSAKTIPVGASGETVALWQDRSGNDNDAVSPFVTVYQDDDSVTGTSRSVLFGGSVMYFSLDTILSALGAFSVVAAVRCEENELRRALAGHTGKFVGLAPGGAMEMDLTAAYTTASLVSSGYRILEFYRDASDGLSFWMNGQELAAGSPSDGGSYFVSVFGYGLVISENWHGAIAEILFSDSVSWEEEGERSLLFRYLAAKRGHPRGVDYRLESAPGYLLGEDGGVLWQE